jgi:UrcA family protein
MNFNRAALLAGAALAAGALAGSASAQTTVEGLTVTGHWRAGENVRSLSAAVPYDDLDLNTYGGREVLKARVRDTARDLCDRLGESRTGDALVRSCEQDAMNSARQSVKLAIASHRMPMYAYLPDEPYVAPAGPTADATSAGGYAADVSAVAPAPSYSRQTVTNGPVPDTMENRGLYGGPLSNGGRATDPAGN